MLLLNQKKISLLNRIPFTQVSLTVTNAQGKRIDNVTEKFLDGKEVQKAEWIIAKTDILKEHYPAECVTQQDLLDRIAILEKKIALQTQK